MNGKPTVISTFAGCGGSSLGYKLAGFKELLAIDFEENSHETFKANFPEVPAWLRDIRTVTAEEILTFCNIKKGELDVFDGSPPCQGFSMSGGRNVSDSRNDLFQDFIRLIEGLQPKVFVMENVSGQVRGKMKGAFIEIMKSLKSLNYVVKCKLLNAANYSVPQRRRRLFYIGVRKDLNKEPKYPVPDSTPIIPVKHAIGDLLDSEGLELKKINILLWDLLKPGEHGDSYFKNRYFNHGKIHWEKPCCTIPKLVGPGFCCLMHPKVKRSLSIAEIKRLSSFPDNFIMIGTFKQQWARIGNSVMPLQMKAVAETIKSEILNGL